MSEELFAVETRDFWHSPELDKIGAALAKAQGEIEGAEKSGINPHFRSKYADLASIWAACRAPLAKNEIAVVQMPTQSGVTTMMVHGSGQFFASRLEMKAKDDTPQNIGSVITYARRYALAAMTGVAPEDDDGNAASGRDSRQPARESETNAPVVSLPRSAQHANGKTDSATKGSIDNMWRQMTDMKSTLNVFAKLKTSICAVLGDKDGEKAYYGELARFGFEHANEFRNPADARLCAKALLELVQTSGPEGLGV